MAEHVTAWLGAYHDGELRGARLRRVEEHLAVCAACRAELDALRGLSALLREDEPQAEFLSTDRFAANLALRLPRRPAGPEPRTNGRLAWWAVPVGLLAVLLFINITFSISSVVAFAADTGLFGGGVEWLRGAPAQMDWFVTALRLLGDRLPAPGWSVLSLLNDANVLIARFARPLIIQAFVAAAYLGWLLAWWLKFQEEMKN